VGPEAAIGGPIGLLHDGDIIVLDTDKRELSVELSDDEMKKRKAQWKAPAPRYTTGVMAKYARLVSSASQGAVTGY
jgi:dihydroxy-acid dehydratase